MSSPKQRLSWTANRSADASIRNDQLRRRGRGRWCAMVLWVMLLPGGYLWSQPPQPSLRPDPLTDAGQIVSFADALFAAGDYFRAITEYKRFLFLYPTHPRAGQVHLQIGRSHLRGQEWEDARETFQAMVRQHPADDVGREAAFLMGETAYLQGHYPQAILELRHLAERDAQTPAGQKARYRLGWSYLRARQWAEAVQAFEAVDPVHPLFPSAHSLTEAARQASELPHRSPALAGALSLVIPGTGHFYTGRFRDGVMALLLNGAFLAAGIEAVTAGNEAAAGLLFFFEAAWYSGSVYGAVNAAHKYNRDQEERWLRGLELQHSPALRSLSYLPHSLVLVRIPF
ncbi:MAG: tetratricopeptide repeat protein [Nitrospinae bacterium]|nr:tetratricopeptide repeat protein [Nitrospinota bacterium]